FLLLLAGHVAGCARPVMDSVTRAEQPGVQPISKNRNRCGSKAIIVDIQRKVQQGATSEEIAAWLRIVCPNYSGFSSDPGQLPVTVPESR
ncbi:MAG: hypothetical protein AAF408_04530, partial [Pseudomonadota bacterium]